MKLSKQGFLEVELRDFKENEEHAAARLAIQKNMKNTAPIAIIDRPQDDDPRWALLERIKL